MKKELKRKLTLSKTTIDNLVNNEMELIQGGAITNSCPFPPFNCATGIQCTAGCPDTWDC